MRDPNASRPSPEPSSPTFFEDLKAYVGFGEPEAAALRELHARVAPLLGELADRYLAVAAAHPAGHAAAVADVAEQALRRVELIEWMTRTLLGPHDEALYAYLLRLGHSFIARGVAQRYVFAGVNVLRVGLHRLAAAHDGHDQRDEGAAEAVDMLLDLELAIFLRSYQEHSDHRLRHQERHTQTERLTAMQALTSGLAHEMRNPLNSARLQLELLERRLRRADCEPKLLEPVAVVHAEIDRLSTLLQEFLEFARPSAMKLGEHDLIEIADRVLELERAASGALGIQLALVGDRAPLLIRVDGAKIQQVIVQLVRNAIEALTGPGSIEIEARRDPGDGFVRMLVRDDGPGIPAEIRARIYEPFFSTKPGGTGLGLATAHSLIDMHGGALAVRCDHGTEFEMRLPSRP